MKIGTKSLLFGIHQVLWHPYVVYKAWKYLYGRPTWKEFVCIFVHDWGYWGKPNLDGKEGIYHPVKGAMIACKLFGVEYQNLCAGHSRGYVKKSNEELQYSGLQISKLCWADKLSFCYEPSWFYILRARLSGEIKEIRSLSETNGIISMEATHKEWFKVMCSYCKELPKIKELIESHK